MTLQQFVYSMNKLNRKFESAICCLQASTGEGIQFEADGVPLGVPGDVQNINFVNGDVSLVGNDLTVIFPRFGVATEDDLAGENRLFNLTGANTFKINGETQIRFGVVDPVGTQGTLFNMSTSELRSQWLDPIGNITVGNTFDVTQAIMEYTDPTGISRFFAAAGTTGAQQTDPTSAVWNTGLSLNSAGSSLTAVDVVNSVDNTLTLGVGAGGLNLRSFDVVNANFTQLTFTPDTALMQVVAGLQVVKVEMTPNAFSTNSLLLSYDDGAGTLGSITIKPGTIYNHADNFRILTSPGTVILTDINASTCTIGDLSGTRHEVSIANGELHSISASGKYRFDNVVEYADNAAAVIGGLTVGYIYRTGDLLKIVH